MNKDKLVEKIHILPDQIGKLVGGLSEADLTTHFLMKEDGSPEWTVAQNVHHLADTHMNCYIRCKLIMTEDNPQLWGNDVNGWAAMPGGKSADIADSLMILRGLHANWTKFWQSLNGDDWSRTGIHPRAPQCSLEFLLGAYAGHGDEHIDQIKRTLAAKK
jgi:hypothetical protein